MSLDPAVQTARVNTAPRTRRKPELMSPAGGWPQVHAAIEAGADAVFFGLTHFSARAKVGFTLEELPELMQLLRARQVKGFVAFNTLIFDRELAEAERAIMAMAAAGVDAIIVQDVGVARLAHQIAPELHVHGSTQMSITSAEGAELAGRWGANRVVLGRELSLRDMERICQATNLEIEVFVHGALCVSYSGQCFSSEAWGGRSANRGQCAQACRLPYDLMVDNQERDLGEYHYLLSPGDLYALEHVPELVRIGIDCFKIEGRYKDADYVAAVTQAYRKAIDAAWEQQEHLISASDKQDLEQVYSRGLGDYFVAGTNHQRVVQGRAPRHRGVRAGTVTAVVRHGVRAQLDIPIKPGDGLVFDAAHWRSLEEPEEGGRVYEVFEQGAETELRFGYGEIDGTRVRVGDWIWRTNDPSLRQRLRTFTEAKQPRRTHPLHWQAVATLGEPLSLLAQDETGLTASATSTVPLQAAQKRALDAEQLAEHLGKLGGTPFHLGRLTANINGALFLPVSELNALRRSIVDQILDQRETLPVREIVPQLAQSLATLPNLAHINAPEQAQLHILVRTPEQLDAAIAVCPSSITLDYLELYGLKPSVQKVKDAGIAVRVASPRILKPTEQNIQKFLLSLDAELLVRSGGLLESLQQVAHPTVLTGDFSLNTANALTAQAYLELGLQRLTPTHDLNAQQICDLASEVPAERLEVIAYQHLPVFHTEHCVFCRFLSTGTDYTNCGHPCEQHKVALRDRQGRLHPVMADIGCRNTVFGAEAQTSPDYLESWQLAGIRHYRLEFVHENAEQVREISLAFQAALAGEISAETLSQRIQPHMATTEGSLFVPEDFGALPQLI